MEGGCTFPRSRFPGAGIREGAFITSNIAIGGGVLFLGSAATTMTPFIVARGPFISKHKGFPAGRRGRSGRRGIIAVGSAVVSGSLFLHVLPPIAVQVVVQAFAVNFTPD